ncbi:MAG: Mur ligase family protein [Candidatus Saccharibacteria bacterium]|nr:Mur ligase family protein [Candidatus Saccharibacteria bacterium]
MKEYNIDEFQKWLEKYVNFEHAPDASLFRLETTERLCEELSHPELSYKTFHVTGSKGKGSVSKMISCILDEMQGGNSPVGVYASPHIYDFRERVSTANGFFENNIYNKSIKDFTTYIDKLSDHEDCGSWFELNAAFGMNTFREAGCNYAVFEVGMGGRLDATNVIKPEICAITTIELEHTEFLGDTLEKIALEKAGIIKESTPVVVFHQKTKSVDEVFIKKANEMHAPIYFVEDYASVSEISYENSRMHIQIEGELFEKPLEANLQMLSPVQAKNACMAAVVMKIYNPEITNETIKKGLEKASLPGRFEIRGNLILDGAHTPLSVKNTVETFEKLYQNSDKKYLIFGMALGKDLAHVVPLFKDKFDKIYVTKPGDFKKSDVSEITRVFCQNNIEIIADEDYKTIIKQALAGAEQDHATVLATGSFYLLNEINQLI